MAEIGLQRWPDARDSLKQIFALDPLADRHFGKTLHEARDRFQRVTHIMGNDRAAESVSPKG